MADVFKSTATIGTGWNLDGAIINFGSSGTSDDGSDAVDTNRQIMATGCSLQYQRANTPINPINRNERFVIAGDPKGAVSIDAIVAPSDDIKAFIEKFADPCEYETNKLTIKSIGKNKCKTSNFHDLTFTCMGCLMDSLTIQVTRTGGDNMVMAGIHMSFVTLELTKVN